MRIALYNLRQTIVGQACQPQFLLRLEPAYHGKTEGEDLRVDTVPIQYPEPLLDIPQDINVSRPLRLHEGTDGDGVQAPPFGTERDRQVHLPELLSGKVCKEVDAHSSLLYPRNVSGSSSARMRTRSGRFMLST